MHAAMSKSVDVFNQVVRLLEKEVGRQSLLVAPATEGLCDEERADQQDSQEQQTRRNHGEQQTVKINGKSVFVDLKGMNLLHFACRDGCSEILGRLLSEIEKVNEGEADIFLQEFLRAADVYGRTPLMLLLRQDGGSSGSDDVSKKLAMLLSKIGQESDRADSSGGPRHEFFTEPGCRPLLYTHWMLGQVEDDYELKSAQNPTALMHAAHGGWDRLRVACDEISLLLRDRQNILPDADGLNLDFALGMAGAADGHGGTPSPRSASHGMLLKEAARGGHIDVLRDVVSAIQVGMNLSRASGCDAKCTRHEQYAIRIFHGFCATIEVRAARSSPRGKMRRS